MHHKDNIIICVARIITKLPLSTLFVRNQQIFLTSLGGEGGEKEITIKMIV